MAFICQLPVTIVESLSWPYYFRGRLGASSKVSVDYSLGGANSECSEHKQTIVLVPWVFDTNGAVNPYGVLLLHNSRLTNRVQRVPISHSAQSLNLYLTRGVVQVIRKSSP